MFMSNDDPFVQRVHDALREQIDNGLSGVVAARTRIPEHQLVNWINDVSLVFTSQEIESLAETLGVTVTPEEQAMIDLAVFNSCR